MNKTMKPLLFLSILFIMSSPLWAINWLDDLAGAHHRSKLFKKPVLLWVGQNSYRTRPQEISDPKFEKISKKLLCVNLNPKAMTDSQRAEYGVNNSNFSRFYYYDIDGNLLGTEDSPPKAIVTWAHSMLKSMEKKEEEKKSNAAEKKSNAAADKMWKQASALEVKEEYDRELGVLRALSKKYPNTSYGDLAKAKIEEINSDENIQEIIKAQRAKKSAKSLLRSAKTFIKNNKSKLAIKKLEKLRDKHPELPQGKEAIKLLEKLREE